MASHQPGVGELPGDLPFPCVRSVQAVTGHYHDVRPATRRAEREDNPAAAPTAGTGSGHGAYSAPAIPLALIPCRVKPGDMTVMVSVQSSELLCRRQGCKGTSILCRNEHCVVAPPRLRYALAVDELRTVDLVAKDLGIFPTLVRRYAQQVAQWSRK